jgi:hypothetical protein
MEIQTPLEPLLGTPLFGEFSALGKLFTMIDGSGVRVAVRPCEKGTEFRLLNEVHGKENRSFLRIYFPSDTKCVLFFHKKSQVPFSRDRYSYGCVVVDIRSSGRFNEEDVRQWIVYMLSGFQPVSKPEKLQKSCPYEIPED